MSYIRELEARLVALEVQRTEARNMRKASKWRPDWRAHYEALIQARGADIKAVVAELKIERDAAAVAGTNGERANT